MARILIADDTTVCRSILALLLTHQGHSVKVAEDGQQALDALKSSEFDLIILDHNMPGFSGLEVLTKLRQGGPLKSEQCPVIVISGGVTPEERAGYEALGVIDIHKKPADPKYLSDQVARLFAKPKDAPRLDVRHLTLVGSRYAPFDDYLRKFLPPDDIILRVRAEQFNSGQVALDPTAITLVQFAEDLTPAGQKLLEEKMAGVRVVLCSTRTVDQLEESGFRPGLVFRFGVRSMPVADALV